MGNSTVREVEAMGNPAVVFGGPSPHQRADRAAWPPAAGGGGADPVVLYWSKTGGWCRVAEDGEAGDYADGIPPKAREAGLFFTNAGAHSRPCYS